MSQETVVGATEKQNLSCSENDARVSETVIVIQEDSTDSRSVQESAVIIRDSENRSGDSGQYCVTGIVAEKMISAVKNDQKSWVVDVRNGDEEICDGGRVCRICHLNSEQPWKLPFFAAKTDLIQLGCGCKGELSNVHTYCAEAWFKVRGNRICEICGETANNIRGVGNESFMEEWKDTQLNRNATNASDMSTEGCSHGQPLCNFLMACLVIAFVLPWFFRINMF